jgi:glycosyltransferase involved in cell wall biosynthesis
MTRPLVSIVIATRNRAALLAQTLDALAGQRGTRRPFEIVVADNLSTDNTHAVVDAFAARPDAPATRYLFVSTPGKSHAVNSALEYARGDLVVFTDDDVLPSPSWLEAMAASFDDAGVDFVAGRIFPRWEIEPPSWMSPALYGVLAIPDNGDRPLPIGAGDDAIIPIGANMAVRRAVIDRVGGLRADLGKLEGTLRTGEDHEFFLRMLRAGCRGRYVPDAVVQHWVPRTRLDRSYFRKWLHQNGQDVARLESAYTVEVRRLFGVPRYLWRQAAIDAGALVRAAVTLDARRRFASSLRLIWFTGYVRDAWRTTTSQRADAPLTAG